MLLIFHNEYEFILHAQQPDSNNSNKFSLRRNNKDFPSFMRKKKSGEKFFRVVILNFENMNELYSWLTTWNKYVQNEEDSNHEKPTTENQPRKRVFVKRKSLN